MFYISSHKYKGSVELWGVTDTNDGVEEFYTKGMLEKFFRQGLEINGLVYTGSYFKFKVTNLSIILMESLDKGSSFYIDDICMLYVGRDALDDFVCFDGNSYKKVTRNSLLMSNSIIDLDNIDKDKELQLKRSYIKINPTSQLSYWLEKEINS